MCKSNLGVGKAAHDRIAESDVEIEDIWGDRNGDWWTKLDNGTWMTLTQDPTYCTVKKQWDGIDEMFIKKETQTP